MTKKSDDIVITCALRTPIGKYNGNLGSYKSYDLGSIVIKNLLLKSKIPASDIDEVILGQVLTGNTGQNPARQAAINGGIPINKTAYIINQVCGSGLRSIASAYQSLKAKDADIIIAGGQESMTNCDKNVMLKDGLIDVYNKYHMGGIQVLLQAFRNGSTIIDAYKKDRQYTLNSILKYEVTNISATPTFYRMLLPIDKKYYSVNRITVGGERIDSNTIGLIKVMFPNAKINNIYAFSPMFWYMEKLT